MRKRLSDRVIRGLATDRPQEDCWDTDFSGGSFGVRVSKTGRKVFQLMYRHGNRLKRKTLGTYPSLSLADARNQARRDIGQVATGTEPQARNTAPTFGELAEDFIEKHPQQKGLRPKTVKEYSRILTHNLLPDWKNIPVEAITKADVNRLLDNIAYRQKKGVMANRVLGLASVMFNYAVNTGDWGIESNPAHRVKRRVVEEARERVLSEGEIRKLWLELGQLPATDSAALYKLLLLTGQRSGEVKHMRRDQIEGDVWTIPASLTKNKKTHRIPLSGMAVDVLEGMTIEAGALFTSHSWIQARTDDIRKAVGFHFTLHDLRRTVATRMAELGIEDTTIGRVLNHSWATRNVTSQVYLVNDRLPEKRAALELWASRLQQIVNGEAAKVVGMK